MLLVNVADGARGLFFITSFVLREIGCRCELGLGADLLAKEVEDEGHRNEKGREAAADGHSPVDADAWRKSAHE